VVPFIRILQLPAEDDDLDQRVSIGRVKRDLSELINRVAFGGERIVLTSRGNPKAALVGLDDYERLSKGASDGGRLAAVKERNERLVRRICERRGGKPLPLDEILEANRRDLEERDGARLGS
jgi:prevent-host-death family protein